MPTQTFANLPAAKRDALLTLALEEFAAHPYQQASLSQIVERAGIAKGSIYQYFANKQDLYLFLIEHAAQSQLDLLSGLEPPDLALDLFALLRWQMRASLQVGLATPLQTQLLYRAHNDPLPFRDEVTHRLQQAGGGHLHTLLAQAQARGELAPDLDLDVAAFVVGRVLGDLRELLLQRLGVSLDEAAGDLRLLESPVAEALYDQVLRILQCGLAARPVVDQSG
ncbi:MAG: TetR/AcrR family transcriptional regulator [Oscillochloridaceae bacterium umkhey_bin13]